MGGCGCGGYGNSGSGSCGCNNTVTEIAQSLKNKYNDASTPQSSKKKKLVVSVVTSEDKNARQLYKGNTRHPIFCDDKYKYMISSSKEKLYRVPSHREPSSKETDAMLVYKRVQRENIRKSSLAGYNIETPLRHRKPFKEVKYDIYQLIKKNGSHKKLCGYKLVPKASGLFKQTAPEQAIYFELEEKRGDSRNEMGKK